jgi:hypothetical protein
LPLAVASVGIALFCFSTRRCSAGAVWSVLAVLFCGLALHFSAGFDDSIFYSLLGSILPWLTAVTAMLLVALLWYIWRSGERSARFGWGWAAIAYLPLLQAPNTGHIFYIPSIGWAIVLGCAARSLVAVLLNKTKAASSPLPASA